MPADAADLMHPGAAGETEVIRPAAVPESLESPGGQLPMSTDCKIDRRTYC